MNKRIAFVGAGAVGGYVAGRMTNAGYDVTVLDGWPAHVEAMNKDGLRLSGVSNDETMTVKMKAMHLSEAERLSREKPIDVAIISTKSYDTDWAAQLIKQYLAEDGFVISLQNCINEERIASHVGWGKTVGCIASGISVELYEPGAIFRGGDKHIVFRLGEPHGRITPRIEEMAEAFRTADSTKTTDNLWGERWSKLLHNSMQNGIAAATGLSTLHAADSDAANQLKIRIGGEAALTGYAQGFKLVNIMGLPGELYAQAGKGDAKAKQSVLDVVIKHARAGGRSEKQRASMGQDIAKKRRTEIGFLNGFVAAKGAEVGIPCPANKALVEVVSKVERGALAQSPKNVEGL